MPSLCSASRALPAAKPRHVPLIHRQSHIAQGAAGRSLIAQSAFNVPQTDHPRARFTLLRMNPDELTWCNGVVHRTMISHACPTNPSSQSGQARF
jgi:hypothetical protein